MLGLIIGHSFSALFGSYSSSDNRSPTRDVERQRCKASLFVTGTHSALKRGRYYSRMSALDRWQLRHLVLFVSFRDGLDSCTSDREEMRASALRAKGTRSLPVVSLV